MRPSIFVLVLAFLAAAHLCAVTVEPKQPEKKTGWMLLNDLFGAPIWSDYYLWDDPPEEVAKRLNLPEESRTSTMASYRAYTSGGRQVVKEPCYSFAMFCDTGRISSISIVFANQGDFPGMDVFAEPWPEDEEDEAEYKQKQKKVWRKYYNTFMRASTNVENRLTALLHAPREQKFGEGKDDTVEVVKRWDVKGHALLFTAPKDEYVALRIVPTEVADAEGRMEHLADSVVREMMKSRVVTRENGDVIISDIPMIDQGDKGFCVSATWSRYLAYMGIHIDLYLLASTAQTRRGGGARLSTMLNNINWFIYKHGRRMEIDAKPPLIKYVDGYINDGVPIIWPLMVDEEFYVKELNERAAKRREMEDWDEWAFRVQQCNREARNRKFAEDEAHVCMIIGYNKKTREIATTDSWGAEFEERWLTEEEAKALGPAGMIVIKW